MEENKSKQDPFADFMWMENIDDFDRQVEEELLEEEFIRACIEQLLEEEDERETLTAAEIIAQQQNLQGKDSVQNGTHQSTFRNGFQASAPHSNGYTNGYANHNHSAVVKSKLNPNAKVFVPQNTRSSSS
ncbi:polyadenylate-binding protein-interacting protein 2-like [Montipora capricornis]|uniref:polyadenylate-binding protein-interacting protein 2-like n=1 Tax=Montipora foliosa TaxID=591990 RepID=UPI0035F11858